MLSDSDALQLHTLRAAYLGGHIWGKTLVPIMNAPSPCEWGWLEFPNRFYPQYTSVDIISRKLPNLKTCSCWVMCEPPWSCCILDILCIGLCGCMGNCFGKNRKKASASNQSCWITVWTTWLWADSVYKLNWNWLDNYLWRQIAIKNFTLVHVLFNTTILMIYCNQYVYFEIKYNR